MKKIIFPILSLILIFSAGQALAINLDKLVNAVGEVSADQNNQKNSQKKSVAALKDGLFGNIEEKVNKLVERIETRVEQYEKKIEKAEKATDRIINTINKFDSSEIEKYITIAKYVAIAVAATFGLFILLLILVFVQLLRVSSLLKKYKKTSV